MKQLRVIAIDSKLSNIWFILFNHLIYHCFLDKLESVIQARRLGPKVFLSSMDLYDLLQRDRQKYYIWLQRNVIWNMSLTVPNDYLIFRKSQRGPGGHPIDLYLSPDVAKYICMKEGTFVSKRIRIYIREVIEHSS